MLLQLVKKNGHNISLFFIKSLTQLTGKYLQNLDNFLKK